jgi:general secretion pathway protein D
VDTEKKVPLLGDIPLLGWAFKHKTTDDAKKELLIFLTPHIISRPSDLAAHTANEMKKAENANKAFSGKELERFLDQTSGPQFQDLPPATEVQN